MIFFTHIDKYLNNVVDTAVNDRRHGATLYMAAAISLQDLLNQVAKLCPPDTEIPSKQWLRLQFAPKVPSSLASLQYTGRFNVRFAVQSRLARKEHVDAHYASALFRYMKEFSVKFKQYTVFICQDDKHLCKVGEPDSPVAAVDRGRQVVGDHDFTKFSIVPSANFVLDIPDNMDGSFNRGRVYVGIKDLVFEPSSPLRHATELAWILEI